MLGYKVLFSKLSDSRIDSFLEYRESHCLYEDSWIWAEDFLVQRHTDYCRNFVTELRETINEKLSWWMLWEIQEKNEYFLYKKVVLTIGSYNVVLFCQQWEKEKIVIIEDMYIQLKR
jgi:hypothetical protein